jgi:hypothetical protein
MFIADDLAAASAGQHHRLMARVSSNGLIYRTQNNARRATADVRHDSPAAFNVDGSVLSPDMLSLAEGCGRALGLTRIELSREWKTANARLFARLRNLRGKTIDLQHEVERLTVSHKDALARIVELERQAATTRALADKIKALEAAIAVNSPTRDFDVSRIDFLEAVVSTVIPMPARS